jgi:nucleotide-binding universal stress UspA family protein
MNMYSKIMVPLDGSKLAECVLPHVETLAKGCQVKEVEFIRIFEPFRMPSGSDFVMSEKDAAKIDAENKADAEKYIQGVVKTAQNMGIKVSGKVLQRNEGVAEDLAGYASKSGSDLIVIATHGRSGPSRWVWGSVADRILRSSCVPVLMVRAPGCTPGI